MPISGTMRTAQKRKSDTMVPGMWSAGVSCTAVFVRAPEPSKLELSSSSQNLISLLAELRNLKINIVRKKSIR